MSYNYNISLPSVYAAVSEFFNSKGIKKSPFIFKTKWFAFLPYF